MNAKKKILEISSFPPPHSGWGVRVALVKDELVRLGHDCEVLNIGPSRRIKSPDYNDVQSGWHYLSQVFEFVRRGYRVHMHMNGQSPKGLVLSLISLGVARLYGRPGILTFHAGTNQTYFPRERCGAWLPVFCLIFRLAKRIICNDARVKAKIVEYGVRPDKVVPIPAFTTQYLEAERTGLEPDLEAFLESHEPVLASYSLFRPTFHVDTTLRALNRLRERWPNIGMVFVGSTKKAEDMDPASVHCLVDELGIGNALYWAGDMTHGNFLELLRRSRISVRTYEYDGICSSVLEALSLGVPVVACHNELRPEGTVLFETGNDADLAAKIAHVLDNYDEVRASLKVAAPDDTLAKEIAVLVGGAAVREAVEAR